MALLLLICAAAVGVTPDDGGHAGAGKPRPPARQPVVAACWERGREGGCFPRMSCLLRPSVPSALARPARPTLTRPRPFFAYGLKRKEWKKGRGAGGGEGNLAALSSLPFFVPPSESTLAAISGSLPCPSEPSSLPPRRRSAESSGARERATESTLRKLPFRSLAPHSPERRRPH